LDDLNARRAAEKMFIKLYRNLAEYDMLNFLELFIFEKIEFAPDENWKSQKSVIW